MRTLKLTVHVRPAAQRSWLLVDLASGFYGSGSSVPFGFSARVPGLCAILTALHSSGSSLSQSDDVLDAFEMTEAVRGACWLVILLRVKCQSS